jgi:hypothetical protein
VGQARSDTRLAYSLTSEWTTGEPYLDWRTIAIPCDLPPGAYSLLVAIYEYEGVANLSILYGDNTPYGGDIAYLTTVTIEARP